MSGQLFFDFLPKKLLVIFVCCDFADFVVFGAQNVAFRGVAFRRLLFPTVGRRRSFFPSPHQIFGRHFFAGKKV
jgi:hypothetical protein